MDKSGHTHKYTIKDSNAKRDTIVTMKRVEVMRRSRLITPFLWGLGSGLRRTLTKMEMYEMQMRATAIM